MLVSGLRRSAAAIGMVVLAGCHSETGPLVIGAVGPWHFSFLERVKMAIELAVEEIDASGGINGRALQVVFANDSADAELAAGIAGEFVADQRVRAVLGPLNSGALLAAARVFDGRLAAISPTAVSPDLTGISRWVFRLMTNDSVFAIVLGERASRIGRRVAILYDNNSFGRGGAETFRRNFRGVIVSYDPVPPGTTDFGPFIQYYRSRSVDLVYVAGINTTGLEFLRERRRLGFTAAVLGADTWATDIPDSAMAEGAYIAARFSILDPRSEAQRFAAAFRSRFGIEADGLAAYAYDAVHLLARSLAEGGTSRRAVRDFLASLDSTNVWRGVTGPVAFTSGGDPAFRSFALMQVRNGRLALAEIAVSSPR